VKPKPKRAQQLLAMVAAAIVVTIVVFSYRASARDQGDAQLHAAYEAALSSAPGIVITKLERVGGGFHIEGLRDPRAEPVPIILARAGLAPAADIDLEPFESRDPRLASRFEVLDAAIRELEAIQILFARGTAGIAASDRSVGRAAELVNRAQRAAAGNGLELCVEILGDSDETGSPVVNERLRSKRARSVGEALRASGVAGDILDPHAADPTQSYRSRHVTFRALLRPGTRPQRCQP
jgi:outer membrane protein OmpA-like peptidoglycan-associated protein